MHVVHMILYDLYCFKYELNGLYTVTFGVIFQFLTMFNTIIGAGAVEARAALHYRSGSGSDQMMRLLAAPAPLHFFYANNSSFVRIRNTQK
jgi:hypothetical protein